MCCKLHMRINHLHFWFSLKTKTMYFKPDGTRDKEDRQKASPHIPHMQHGQTDWKVADNEFIEMSAVQASIDSQGGDEQLALHAIYVYLQ